MLSVQKLTFKKIWGHLRTVHTHRKWVRHYCFLAGIPWRGLVHDLSKYSPVEFFESARYWDGKSSPINRAKEEQGISYGWLHHKGRNKHHYEYWMDNFDKGGVARLMPCKDFTEMVCDMLGASVAYTGNKDHRACQRCFDYWKDHKKRGCALNLQNQQMLDIIFADLAHAERLSPENITPEKLLKTGYIQMVWKANCHND
jgi:hypothetical protein